jgi:hypothetical protein
VFWVALPWFGPSPLARSSRMACAVSAFSRVLDDANIRARLAALCEGLARRGWSEGRNIRIDYRYGPAGAQALVKELVALQPEVIE